MHRHNGLLVIFMAPGPIIKIREVNPQPVTTRGFSHWSHMGQDSVTSKTNHSERKLSADTRLWELYPGGGFCCYFPLPSEEHYARWRKLSAAPEKPYPTPFLMDGHPLVLLPVPCPVSLLKSHSISIMQSFLVFVSACLFHFALGVSSFTLWEHVAFPSAGWPRNHCVAQAELQFVAIFLTQSTKYWNFPCGLPHLAICLLNLAVMKVDKKTKRVQWEITNDSGVDADLWMFVSAETYDSQSFPSLI